MNALYLLLVFAACVSAQQDALGPGSNNAGLTTVFPWSFLEKLLQTVQRVGLRLAPTVTGDVAPQQQQQSVLRTVNVSYRADDGTQLIGYMAYYSSDNSPPKPAVLVVPDWNGLDDYEKGRARQLAELGYVGMGIDVYGGGQIGKTSTENQQLMVPFRDNRTRLLERVRAALTEVRRYPFVDTTRVAAIGYCFGGQAVLDGARGGLTFKGVTSFHGALTLPPGNFPRAPITAKVLVLTGYDDPSITPDKVAEFMADMKNRSADFELDSYSGTVHGFTVPDSNSPGSNMYNKQSDNRSWARMRLFFKEIFEGKTEF